MKLALIRQKFTEFGGAEKYVAGLAERLAEAGHEVHILAREWRTDSDRFVIHPIQAEGPGFLRLAAFARAAGRVVEKEGFDLVHSFERTACQDVFRAGDGCHAQWLARRAEMQGAGREWLDRINPRHRTFLRLERAMVQSPGLKYILANSRETAGEFQEWYGFPASRIKVVYNGLDRSRFHPGLVKHREAVRRELGLAPDEPVTLFVGSGFQRKGLGELAEALGRIPGRLLVVGRDDPRPVRRRAAKAGGLDKLMFLGGRTDVERFYGAADVFALPSWYEPFSNACLEAAASGLPVVTTRGSGAAEIIRPGENGCLVDFPVDVHELADRVNHAFSLDRDRVQQVNQPLLAPFSWEKNLSETLAVYNQILGGDWKA